MKTIMASLSKPALRQRGFTLIELMVAMAIGAALMVGVAQVFTSSKAAYRVTENLSRIQENGRFAMDDMSWYVRMAGYKGCQSGVSADTRNVLNNSDSTLYNFAVGIEGFEAVNSGFSGDADLMNTIEAARLAARANDEWENFELLPSNAGTHRQPDAVIVRGIFGNIARVAEEPSGNVPPGSAQLNIEYMEDSSGAGLCPDGGDMISGFCQGDLVMVSDCIKSTLFQITNIRQIGQDRVNVVHSRGSTGGVPPGNAEAAWGGNSADADKYMPGSEFVKAGTRLYFIANRLGTDDQNPLPPVPSLFVMTETGVAELLAENVEDMQIVYGVDTDVDAGSMLRANANALDWTATQVEAADAWDQVVNAEIRLLARSEEQLLTPDGQPQTYMFSKPDEAAQVEYTPTDTRIRRTFVTTVTIRNRALM